MQYDVDADIVYEQVIATTTNTITYRPPVYAVSGTTTTTYTSVAGDYLDPMHYGFTNIEPNMSGADGSLQYCDYVAGKQVCWVVGHTLMSTLWNMSDGTNQYYCAKTIKDYDQCYLIRNNTVDYSTTYAYLYGLDNIDYGNQEPKANMSTVYGDMFCDYGKECLLVENDVITNITYTELAKQREDRIVNLERDDNKFTCTSSNLATCYLVIDGIVHYETPYTDIYGDDGYTAPIKLFHEELANFTNGVNDFYCDNVDCYLLEDGVIKVAPDELSKVANFSIDGGSYYCNQYECREVIEDIGQMEIDLSAYKASTLNEFFTKSLEAFFEYKGALDEELWQLNSLALPWNYFNFQQQFLTGMAMGALLDVLDTGKMVIDFLTNTSEFSSEIWDGLKAVWNDPAILLTLISSAYDEMQGKDVYEQNYILGKKFGELFSDTIVGMLSNIVTGGASMPVVVAGLIKETAFAAKVSDKIHDATKYLDELKDISKIAKYTIDGIEISVKYTSKGVVKVVDFVEETKHLTFDQMNKLATKLRLDYPAKTVDYMVQKWFIQNGDNIVKKHATDFGIELSDARYIDKDGFARTVYQMDIDLDYVGDIIDGRTNIERMLSGDAPYDVRTGKAIEIHHTNQTIEGNWAELPWDCHRGAGNYCQIHMGSDWESRINRNLFRAQKTEYWISRAKELIDE